MFVNDLLMTFIIKCYQISYSVWLLNGIFVFPSSSVWHYLFIFFSVVLVLFSCTLRHHRGSGKWCLYELLPVCVYSDLFTLKVYFHHNKEKNLSAFFCQLEWTQIACLEHLTLSSGLALTRSLPLPVGVPCRWAMHLPAEGPHSSSFSRAPVWSFGTCLRVWSAQGPWSSVQGLLTACPATKTVYFSSVCTRPVLSTPSLQLGQIRAQS